MSPSNTSPYLSVIVPAYNGTGVLPRCFEALAASDLPRQEWELIVVDDSSADGTADLAEAVADRVVRLSGGPRGPAFARNRGCEQARGKVLVFVDADVCVHPDTLQRFASHFRTSNVGSVFGAYDTEPAHPDFLSQYRNLLHRYHHVRGAGEAQTFWAGCGAIRASAFNEVGGYDQERYPKPQIEDIELGYRLRDHGYRIVIDPEIQAKHLKKWGFQNMVRTDVFDRGVPWMRLLGERKHKTKSSGDEESSLNVGAAEKIKTAAVGLGLVLVLVGLLMGSAWIALAGALLTAAIPLVNVDLYRWFAETRGWVFASRVVPMQLLYYVLNGFAAAMGILGLGRGAPTEAPR